MCKRILVLVLLCAGICFSSCSSKKNTYGYSHKGKVIVSESDMYNTGERISYDEYKKQNYELDGFTILKLRGCVELLCVQCLTQNFT